jgi:hypothetical protein
MEIRRKLSYQLVSEIFELKEKIKVAVQALEKIVEIAERHERPTENWIVATRALKIIKDGQ